MLPTFELIAWRASLATAPRVPRAIDLDEWATILTAAGETAGARLLEDCAALWRGVASARAGTAQPWTIGLLSAELDALAGVFEPRESPPPRRRVSGDPNDEGGIGPAEAPLAPPVDLAAAAAGLRAFLAPAICDPSQAVAAEAILASLVEANARLPDLDYREVRDAPLADLAFAIGLVSLIAFALDHRDLAIAPLGSIAMLHRVARLDPEGLGPYLCGVGQVARRSADVVDLARRAARVSGTIDAWIALLSRGCSGLLLLEILDDLGDAARTTALSLILDRTLSRIADMVDLPLVRRIRDAGLDNADWPLAARAQAAVVRLRPQDYHERVILGSIQATGGDYGAAEWVFRDCLSRRPDDRDAAARLHAVRRDRFAGYAVVRGYETPADRQETRLRRRGILPDHVARTGDRITAVDVH